MTLLTCALVCLHGFLYKLRAEFTLLPPANVICEGYVFTGVCLSTGWVRGGQVPGTPP